MTFNVSINENNGNNSCMILLIFIANNDNKENTLLPILLKMSSRKEQLKGGITAMFGETQEPAPQPQEITEEQYQQLERKQSERRFFLTGRKRTPEECVTRNDVRTTIVLDQDQYDIIKEIALRETMTIKDLLYAMFQLGIERYEKRHGKVIVRSGQPTSKDLF